MHSDLLMTMSLVSQRKNTIKTAGTRGRETLGVGMKNLFLTRKTILNIYGMEKNNCMKEKKMTESKERNHNCKMKKKKKNHKLMPQ